MQQTIDLEGKEQMELVSIEKQTDPDRLECVPWDEEKTWKILQN
jgi:hypothetical protein